MPKPPPLEILSVAEMYAADKAAAALGRAGSMLMEAAGAAVAREICRSWSPRRTLIACGPGNNGGDGYVVARHLFERGWPVRVVSTVPLATLRGDAAWAASTWTSIGGHVEALQPDVPVDIELIVDALFGAGLSRGIDGTISEFIAAVRRSQAPVVAVDIPSGIAGDTGQILPTADRKAGCALAAALTVTFFRPKPAHFLFPGKNLCGRTVVADIGIPDAVLSAIAPRASINRPGLWQLPEPNWSTHKYHRGHVVVIGGADVGAARLAARAARRAGAGLLTLAVPSGAVATCSADSPGAFVKPLDSSDDAERILKDPRRNAVVIGPGLGVGPVTADRVLQVLATDKSVVLDADGLTSFAGKPDLLFSATRERRSPTVFTPHDGEFARLFALDGGKIDRARAAADRSGAVVVLKGADSVVAAPDGRVAMTDHSSPWLSTGGSGDVLAGFTGALLGQGMTGFEAAAAAVWLHNACAKFRGPGLIAEDLPDAVAEAVRGLNNQ